MSNIYLDRLDQFIEQQLIPDYNRGRRRRSNPAYRNVEHRLAKARERGDREAARALRRELRSLPTQVSDDPGYRRLRYVRYCDDFLLGFAGPKCEAEEIKARIGTFLREELKLELSGPKTLITHATSQAARFLGYEIRAQHADTKITGNRRSINGSIGLFVPRAAIQERCVRYMSKGKPAQRGPLLHDEDFTIVAKYGSEYRGFVQYYLLAQDVFRLGKLRWVMETSMLKTLAGKHKSTTTKMARRYKTAIETPVGRRTCFEAIAQREGRKPLVARFGGIPLERRRTAVLTDRQPFMAPQRNELIHRLLAGQCEMCEGRERLQVHHVRKLADLDKPGRARTATVDGSDGQAQAENPCGLRALPPRHPQRTGYSHHPEMITGERYAGKTGPYRSGRGRRKRTPARGTSSAAYFTRSRPRSPRRCGG